MSTATEQGELSTVNGIRPAENPYREESQTHREVRGGCGDVTNESTEVRVAESEAPPSLGERGQSGQ